MVGKELHTGTGTETTRHRCPGARYGKTGKGGSRRSDGIGLTQATWGGGGGGGRERERRTKKCNPKDGRRRNDEQRNSQVGFPLEEQHKVRLGRSPTSSNAAALIYRVSILFFEAKSHLHFVFAFTQQR